MSLRSWSPGKEIGNPRGMWSLLASKRKGTPQRASFAQNIRISPGVAQSRPGTSAIAPASGRVTGLYNWITPSGQNLVLYEDAGNINSYVQGGAVTNLLTGVATTRRPSFADLDIWAYFAGYDTTGAGTFQARVFDGTFVDKAFSGPVALTACTPVDGGPGQCTAGPHYIGFVYQSRSGYSGRPSTAVGATPIQVTLAAGLRAINISVTLPALPDGGPSGNGNIQATLFLIATRADNPAKWYFVPAATGASTSVQSQPVPLNTPTTLNFVMDISDEDLAASANSADSQFSLLSQDGSGNGPFNPSFVVAYGSRMCYGSGVNLYVSDINNPQQITADLNAVTTPNQRNIGFAFPLQGSSRLYLTGDRWTSAVNDDADVPATWSPPVGISGAIGAPFPGCVCYKTGGNYAWVVTENGCYLFTGQYSERPITYLVGDQWDRVNWKAAYAIEIADDTVNLKLYIAVPLDGATEPSHMFVIDYTNGITYNTCDITLDIYASGPFSSVGVVKEVATGISNAWIGPSAGGSIIRFDSTTANDQGLAINAYWESGLARGSETRSKMIRIGAGDIRASGLGTPNIIWWTLDHASSAAPPLEVTAGVVSPLSATPGLVYMNSFDLSQTENYTFQFGTNAVGALFILASFTGYTKPDLTNR